MVKKNRERKILEGVEITAMSAEGKGIGRVEGKVIFADFGVPGDVVDMELKKDKKSYAEAQIKTLVKASDVRRKAECSHFGVCGGCKWQHIEYASQLEYKRQIVEDALRKIGKIEDVEIPMVVGCENEFYYRNKLEFAFTNRKWLTDEEVKSEIEVENRDGLGFHVPGSFSGVLDVEHCYLQGGASNKIRTAVREFALKNNYTFFNLFKQEGFLRNLLVRTTATNELLVLISFFENDSARIEALMTFLKNEFPEITSLQYVVNSKRNDTIYDLTPVVFSGRAYIEEQLGNYRFRIGPKSFFQTNSLQAKLLYDITKEFASLKKDDVVYDLYTGVGSIAQYVSDTCKTVVGVEQIEAAIADAKDNAQLNNVTNCKFYAGDVRMILNKDFVAEHGKPSVVITDPPRAGMHEDVVNTLLELEAPNLVYVSCNPATQARDIQLLSIKYQVVKVQPVDMFPHTTHIENVVLLSLKS
jgi:23S rRNA (uracil1939-C5)-methyltransferase